MLADTNAAHKADAEANPAIELVERNSCDRVLAIESRFGCLEIRPENALYLPNGLLGFGEFREFGLVPLPDGRHPQFRVLQCLTQPELAFLVAPLNMDSGAIDTADLRDACAVLDIPRNDLAIILIVTVRRDETGAHVSVNMRAPLFVDTVKRVARQYVMPNNKYSIRHVL